mgnify:CR=1 FL=1
MPELRTKRHLSAADIALTAEWIMDQPDSPSWSEVRKFVLKELGIDRTVEALRRVPDLKKARTARAEAPKVRKRSTAASPTTRKIEALEAHISRLESEIHRLEAENAVLFERNLRLRNGARVHQIPEGDLDRPLVAVNRNPTNLSKRKAKK